ncbi:ComB3 competence protein [Helicobacter sp. NHP19-003]|uniref:ComB3 competence protein n=1 Tax=Helicobacter gastrocanis TaxID=2849641 RepID=A0ABM7SIM4_9HELI|nr:competence protein ComB [Helicobacter sp. NHP19-003]BCZ17938.1 ComB3 competence protein [Helicobacter sp. NHP19-003]
MDAPLLVVSVPNLQAISTKDKFLWLNAKSWIVSVFVPFVLWPWLGTLWALALYGGFLALFSVLEFFDEDIADILIAHSKLTGAASFYA